MNGHQKEAPQVFRINFKGLSMLRRFFPRSAKMPALPRPVHPICVIGDLHGRADLLELMLASIASRDPKGEVRRVFVGDLIDRGPDSAAVLARVHQLCRADPAHYICVMGNHERMLLDFLADPLRHGPRWFAAGGDQTLASFGLTLRYGSRDAVEQNSTLAGALQAIIPREMMAWLAARPLYWQEGSVLVAHAGADAKKPLNSQTETEMLWGHIRHKANRADGIWVVQGHKSVAQPRVQGTRIFTDTAAWQTGRLTAAWIDQTGLDWIKIQPAEDQQAQ